MVLAAAVAIVTSNSRSPIRSSMPGGNPYQNATFPRPARKQTDNALSGAVIAFAKSQPAKPNSKTKESPARAAASAAGSKQLDAPPPASFQTSQRAPSPFDAQQFSSGTGTDSRTLAGKEPVKPHLKTTSSTRHNTIAGFAPSTPKDTNSPRSPYVNIPSFPQQKDSHSHAAAAAAAINRAQQVTPSAPRLRVQADATLEQDCGDVPPTAGTVEGVQKWLQSLDGGLESDNPDTETQRGLSRSETLKTSYTSIRHNRTDNNNDDAAAVASNSDEPISELQTVSLASSLEIASPKPVRPPLKNANKNLNQDTLPVSVGTLEIPRRASRLSITSSIESPETAFRRSRHSPILFSETSTQPESTDHEFVEDETSTLEQSMQKGVRQSSGWIESASLLVPQRPATASIGASPSSVPTRGTIVRSKTITPSQSLPRPRRFTSSTSQDVPLSNDSIQRVESLANAIVASHLASSRAPSPTRPASAKSSRRQAEKRYRPFQQFKKQKQDSRTPSPSKGVQYTMRKDPDSSENEEVNPHHKKRHQRIFIRHPNKHHEGDRKRWRDIITEPERRRYEGVWAANKGLQLTYSDEELQMPWRMENANQQVSNLIVRDIWSRSRLSHSVLEEAWELVDNQGIGRLSKEEFVVGLWLVDQRLKGRKLPYRVGESVWRSVRGIYGLKVPKYKHR